MTAPQEADFFRLPLLNGQVGFGQVIAPPEGTILVALSCQTGTAGQLPTPFVLTDIIAFARCKPDHFANSTWTLAGFDQIPNVSRLFDIAKQGRDLDPHDPVIIEAFCSAWHGLYPWDAFGTLFDKIAAGGVNQNRVRS